MRALGLDQRRVGAADQLVLGHRPVGLGDADRNRRTAAPVLARERALEAGRRRCSRPRPARRAGSPRTRRRRCGRRCRPARRTPRSFADSRRSRSSPAWWPSVSLVSLRPTRSSITSAQRSACGARVRERGVERLVEGAVVEETREVVAQRGVEGQLVALGQLEHPAERADAAQRRRPRAPRSRAWRPPGRCARSCRTRAGRSRSA